MKYEVSVCVLTYNHEKYIEKALDTIFLQKTNFLFEVLIFDDASTDNTCLIIKQRYGDKVTLYRHNENQGINKNLYDALTTANGKYIALAAGDDWWLTTEYLQSLYDYLNTHGECVSVSPCTVCFNQNQEETGRLPVTITQFTMADFLWSKNVAVIWDGMLRNIFGKERKLEWLYLASRNNDEFQYFFYILTRGSIGVLNKYLRAYRSVPAGGSNYNSSYDYVDTYIDRSHAMDYIKKNVTNEYAFKYYRNKNGAVALKLCLGDLIKRKKAEPLKKMCANTNIFLLVTFFFTLLLLELSGGEYPEWYKKGKKIYRK